MSNLLSRVVLPLACGGLGGLLALGLFSPAPAAAEAAPLDCKELAAQVSSLQTMVKDLHAERSMERLGAGVQAPVAARALDPVEEAQPQKDQEVLEDLKRMREEMESRRAEQEVRQAERSKAGAEVELVKLRTLQKTLTLVQTKANVVRHLEDLGLSESDLAAVSELGAPYIRQRSEHVIRILEQVSSGTKVSRGEMQEQLRPLEENFARSLPSNLDETTRHAIATELKSMVDVPRFLSR